MTRKNQKMIAVKPSVYNELKKIRENMKHPIYGLPTFNQLIGLLVKEKKEK